MFAVIHIPNFALQAALRLEPELKSRAAALVDSEPGKTTILQLTPAARERGVFGGSTPSQAMARCGDLVIKQRSRAREQSATEILLQTACAFSPYIESTAPGVCTMELKGLALESEADARQWASKIRSALASFHLDAQIGFASAPGLALVLAQAGAHLDTSGRDWRAAPSPSPSVASGDGTNVPKGAPLACGFRPLERGRGHRSAMSLPSEAVSSNSRAVLA